MRPVVSALMCHAPIVVPDVVGARGEACSATTAAMRSAAARIVARRPDVVVVLSPHTPRAPRFTAAAGPRVAGDFGDFGAPDVVVDLPAAADLRAALVALGVAEEGVDLVRRPLDHGALVPLRFVVEAGWTGPTLVVGLPRFPDVSSSHAFGAALAEAAAGTRLALVASGDCSHRLIPGAPAGYAPQARAFDAALTAAVKAGDDEAILAIDPSLRELAAEDVVDTVQIAAAAAGFAADGREVLSYEGPYGVGYLVAILDDAGDDGGDGARVLVDVAHDALRAHLAGVGRRAFDTAAIDAESFAGAFVTWRGGGALRGCVGSMRLDGPVSAAVAELAVKSASADPRFPPVAHHELASLEAEVSLLSAPVPVGALAELDPRVWGVEARHGFRHGVLLPDIEGVDSVEQQVSIVLYKAGIRPHEPYTLNKFRVRKVSQSSS